MKPATTISSFSPRKISNSLRGELARKVTPPLVEESNCVTGFNACFPLDRGRKVTHLPARPREQLKLEAALGKTLIAIVRFLLCSGSSRFRHFSHFQVSVEHSNPNLNEQVCPLIGPAHLPLFCAPQAHHFIDCRFGDTAADGHATPIPPSVIDKVFVIRFQVPIRPAKIPP